MERALKYERSPNNFFMYSYFVTLSNSYETHKVALLLIEIFSKYWATVLIQQETEGSLYFNKD